jgi:hypothetical protein
MTTVWKLVSLSAATALLAACSHTVEREVVQPVVQPAPVVVAPAPTVERVIVQQPAAPQEIVPPMPTPDVHWVPGHWSRVGNDWLWVRGYWQ